MMSAADTLTGRQRVRIILRAHEDRCADDIAEEVCAPIEAVRELCRIAGIKLREREEKEK